MRLAPRLAGSLLTLTMGVTGVLAPLAMAGTSQAAKSKAKAVVCPAPGGTAIAETPAPSSAEIAFHGHGYGHSLGMSQYGAQGAARLGCTQEQILTAYYAGSHEAAAAMPDEVRNWMLVNGTHTDIKAQTGSITWTVAGCTTGCPPVQPRGATWRLRAVAGNSAMEIVDRASEKRIWVGGDRRTTVTAGFSGKVVDLDSYDGGAKYLSRRLRWDELRFTVDGAGLDAVQAIRSGYVEPMRRTVTAMDKYLWGVAEIPLSWTRDAHEAVKAQAVAARTYAYAKLRLGSGTTSTVNLYPTQVNQNYTGYGKESEDEDYADQHGRQLRWADAILTTSGKILLTAGNKPVDTFFTSSMGGHTEDAKFVWGNASVSYLRSFDDSTWDKASDGNYYRSWSRGFSKAHLAMKFGFDTVTEVTVGAPGTLGRLAGVKVTGTIGADVRTKYFTGDAVRIKLGLPSPGFTIAIGGPTDTAGLSAPTAPRIGKATGGAAGAKATATARWLSPKRTGGSTVRGYDLHAIKVDPAGKVLGATTIPLPAASRYQTLVLPAGTYTFEVRARNLVGVGPWSVRSGVVLAR